MIAELDEAGSPTASYVWGLDLSQSMQGAGGVGGLLVRVDHGASKTHHYFYDGNGNVGQLVDSADGALGAAYEYDPFGNLSSRMGDYGEVNPFRFSTKYFDGESGLYYYTYRYYSVALGRWLSRDPIAELGGANLYLFVVNRPIDDFDRLGLLTPEEMSQAQDLYNRIREIKDQYDLANDLIDALKGDQAAQEKLLKKGYGAVFTEVLKRLGITGPAAEAAKKILGASWDTGLFIGNFIVDNIAKIECFHRKESLRLFLISDTPPVRNAKFTLPFPVYSVGGEKIHAFVDKECNPFVECKYKSGKNILGIPKWKWRWVDASF